MISPPSTHQTRFVQIMKTHLEGLNSDSLTQLGKKLFPIMSSPNIFASLYNCFHTFYTIKINKGEKFQDGTKTILKYAQELKDQSIHPKIRDLLNDTQFTTGLEQVIQNELNERKNVITIERTNKNQSQQQKSTPQINPQNNQNSSQANKKNSKTASLNNVVDISEDSPNQNRSTSPQSVNKNIQTEKPQTSIHNFSSNDALNSDPYEVMNLAIRQVCLCGKSCSLMQPKKQMIFKCVHCQFNYHVECMQRGKQNISQSDPIKKLVSCAYCHLRELIPLKQTMKTLFVGVLKQGRKRHQIVFNLDMTDLKTKKWRVQIRCFRLKEKIQTFVLFPDSASFSINNRFEKEFLPLPKQSSLKYRKDEPFLLTQHLINHQNKLTVIERIPKKQSKDDRIEPQNHLLGIFLIQERQVVSIVKQIKLHNIFTFYESKAMLDRCLKIGDAEDITCEVLKIPIMCTLTIQRIRTPVRGIFCSHFQCFDLSNFLILTSSSVNPRWLCPLCKQPAYQFKYDIIIGSIIEQFAKYNPTEIMFTKNGEFKVYETEEKQCPETINNIYNLLIDSKFKRQIENQPTEEDILREADAVTDVGDQKIQTETNQSPVSQGQKKNQAAKGFQIPQDANIISLDDD